MSSLEAQPGHFMTARFYMHARVAGGVAVRANPDELRGMSDFLAKEYGFGLPADPHNVDFAYFWTTGEGHDNPHYHNAESHTQFNLGESLPSTAPQSVSKQDIQARNRQVVELQTKNLDEPNPLALAAARAILGQSPELLGLTAGTKAWSDFSARKGNWRGVADALIGGFAPSRFTFEQRLAVAAASKFPGAVILDRS